VCVIPVEAIWMWNIHFYNSHRPHSSLDGRTPDQAYFNSLPFRAAA
jgi:hypothetical protein